MAAILWAYFVVLSLCVVDVSGKCSITSDWIDLTMEERLSMADIVVYGRTKEHRASTRSIDGRSSYSINAVFEVYCVLKRTEELVPETIVIEGIAPRDGCSGTKTHMQLDSEAIVGLKPTYGGKYEYHEVMPMLSAAFAGVRSNLIAVSVICGLQRWDAPQGATVNRCPICGTANFTSDAISLDVDVTTDRLPCFKDGVFTGNLSDCQLGEQASDSTQCIAETYDQICARMADISLNAGCECTNMNFGDSGDGPIAEIGAAVASLPCMLTVVMGLLIVLML